MTIKSLSDLKTKAKEIFPLMDLITEQPLAELSNDISQCHRCALMTNLFETKLNGRNGSFSLVIHVLTSLKRLDWSKCELTVKRK